LFRRSAGHEKVATGFSDEPRTNKGIGASGSDGTERVHDTPDRISAAPDRRANFPFARELDRAGAGLDRLLQNLAAVPGRKAVVLVSAGVLVSDKVDGRPDVGNVATAILR